jgi:hypothetical protein
MSLKKNQIVFFVLQLFNYLLKTLVTYHKNKLLCVFYSHNLLWENFGIYINILEITLYKNKCICNLFIFYNLQYTKLNSGYDY